MIRVLHVIHSLNVGGVETFLVSLLEQIPREKIAMDIICKARQPGVLAPLAEARGARVYCCPLTPTHVGFTRGLTRIIQEAGYHVVHNHLDVYSGIPVWVAKRCNVKVITSYANTEFISGSSWSILPGLKQMRSIYGLINTKYALWKADVVTGWSHGVLDAIVPDHERRPNCQVLQSGAKIERIATAQDRREIREEFGLAADSPIVLHAGRFCVQKNHQGIVAIFKEVLRAIPTARLLLAGEGPLLPDMKRVVHELGIQEHVSFLGLRKDVGRLMRGADVFLLPSFFEGLPMVGIEALAAQLPIVASDIAGVRDEIVRLNETGFMRPVHDIAGLAEDVVRVINNRELALRLGVAGRRLAETYYSLEAAAARYIKLYERVTASPGHAIGDAQSAMQH